MAGIDKIYGTQHQYTELRKWIKANKPEFVSGLYPVKRYNHNHRPISNFTTEQDEWLIDNCPLGFIQERLTRQYGNKQDAA